MRSRRFSRRKSCRWKRRVSLRDGRRRSDRIMAGQDHENREMRCGWWRANAAPPKEIILFRNPFVVKKARGKFAWPSRPKILELAIVFESAGRQRLKKLRRGCCLCRRWRQPHFQTTIAGFSSEFVRDALDRYLPKNRRDAAVVLDPFCGVGTTLIEALRCGHNAIGFEINPYAALAARAKCEAAAVSPLQVNDYILKFGVYMRAPEVEGDSFSVPEHFRSRIPFFGPRAEVKVLKTLRFINRLRVAPIRDLFALAFGSVMVSLSNYSYEPSLSSRPAVGKPTQDDAPVTESIVTKLLAIAATPHWPRHRRQLPQRLAASRPGLG